MAGKWLNIKVCSSPKNNLVTLDTKEAVLLRPPLCSMITYGLKGLFDNQFLNHVSI